MIKALKYLTLAAAFSVVPQACFSEPVKKPRKAYVRSVEPRPVYRSKEDIYRGNAALGGNNANSAYGSNSAEENANGRTSGGFGGN
ncbi:hypothetical protein RPMA_13125 [Tardiphaga alba]|uniref:DUF680 domain-containing protein n=1 Tax=Tardiphaga alba TaxID=340268 RepID=A0ABX8ABH8_9BRAD|nr:hypothetical protein [Tardiphaga alba]QUS39675.1 hypothetical protein RPMA_13125 [Tardiphaga alba]